MRSDLSKRIIISKLDRRFFSIQGLVFNRHQWQLSQYQLSVTGLYQIICKGLEYLFSLLQQKLRISNQCTTYELSRGNAQKSIYHRLTTEILFTDFNTISPKLYSHCDPTKMMILHFLSFVLIVCLITKYPGYHLYQTENFNPNIT